jgi:hypothetical protein
VAVDPDVPADIVERLRAVCLRLPEVVEEEAWVGLRWRVRTKTFAHVVAVHDGRPAAYATAAGTDGPATVLTFRSWGEELAALTAVGPPFFKPVWFRDIVGVVLGDDVDWAEIDELLTESYCLLAPARLGDLARG